MQITYGSMPTSLPEGMLVAVRFPTLMLMDKATGDGRLFLSAGASARHMPASISAQFKKDFGHMGADLTGVLHEATFDSETGIVSARGFLADDEFGRRHAMAIKTQMMEGNSVGLADIANVRFIYDEASGEETIEFGKWALADTTGVMTPAFADAMAELEGEIKAAFSGDGFDPMEELVASFAVLPVRIPDPNADPTAEQVAEIVASFGTPEPYESFFIPEASKPQKIVFAANGDVYGHLGLWESCHDGVEGRCVRIPRPTDGYASWNKPGVLTEKGIIGTGPICLYGGHGPVESSYDGVENGWADVRITEGKFGPWMSGRARPSLSEDQIRVARASRVSGHWKGGALKAIVSVNAEGYDVPGDDLIAASFGFSMDADGRVDELVASFPACVDGEPSPIVINQHLGYADPQAIADAVRSELVRLGLAAPEAEDDPLAELERELLAEELEDAVEVDAD